MQQSVAGTIEVADTVIDADAAVAADPSLIERLGLVGEHPDTAVAEAKQALAAGDEAAARAAAQRALDVVGDAGSKGTARAAAGAGVLVLLGVGVLVVVVVRRRRRVRQPTPDPSR